MLSPVPLVAEETWYRSPTLAVMTGYIYEPLVPYTIEEWEKGLGERQILRSLIIDHQKETLLNLLGSLEHVMRLELAPERSLAQADTEEVRRNLEEKGFVEKDDNNYVVSDAFFQEWIKPGIFFQ